MMTGYESPRGRCPRSHFKTIQWYLTRECNLRKHFISSSLSITQGEGSIRTWHATVNMITVHVSSSPSRVLHSVALNLPTRPFCSISRAL